MMRISKSGGSSRCVIAAVAVVTVILLSTEPAQAQQLFSSGTQFLTALVDVLTSTWARLLGVIAVVITGIMWMTGRLQMVWALSVIGGLILVFGASSIVDSVAGVV